MKCCFLLVLLLTVAGADAAAVQDHGVLLPVDEAAKNPGFLEFRNRLKAIVARRDTKALLENVHPDIRASFGSDNGIRAFREMWKLDRPDSTLWKELGTVLDLGGSFDGPDSFTAPYVFSRWPNNVDSFEFMAVVGRTVRIRTAPGLDAPVLASVSHAILEGDRDGKSTEEWIAVKHKGRHAFISSRYVRIPIDYRANFRFSDGRWQMVFFVAGD